MVSESDLKVPEPDLEVPESDLKVSESDLKVPESDHYLIFQEIPSHQVDVTRMGQMATLLYTSLALCARATMHQRGQLFGYSDMCRSAIISVLENIAEFEHLYQQAAIGPHESGDKIFNHIHSRNMKFGGYFAFSPLDKNLY